MSDVKFLSGQLLWSNAITTLVAEDIQFSQFIHESFARHMRGDWGEVDEVDRRANDRALEEDGRLHSAYNNKLWKIWIITEYDRSATTILFPWEN